MKRLFGRNWVQLVTICVCCWIFQLSLWNNRFGLLWDMGFKSATRPFLRRTHTEERFPSSRYGFHFLPHQTFTARHFFLEMKSPIDEVRRRNGRETIQYSASMTFSWQSFERKRQLTKLIIIVNRITFIDFIIKLSTSPPNKSIDN